MQNVLSVHSLASGSSGNSTLIKSTAGNILIDAGISVRSLTAYLKHYAVVPNDLSAIIITHEHGDHIASAYSYSKKYRIPIIANHKTLSCIYNKQRETEHIELQTGSRYNIGDIIIETFPVPHDAVDPVGINVIDSDSKYKLSLITDAGYVSDIMCDAVNGSHLIVLESNHDVHRLLRGSYPGYLKERILGEKGHLSNEAAVKLLCRHALRHGPFTAWLAHLSKENNTPKLALGYAKATIAVETGCPLIIDVAKRDKPSATWIPQSKPIQLNLF